ncbi:MAG TPA: FtsX-like permease family protein [Mycobacteriales bacterium]|nr:FtsX-like permease family protein [Mycobacteriales bacterium]
MIRLGLRLSLAGSKEAAIRLAVTAIAVALGVGLLLLTLACTSALHAQDRRVAWLETSQHNRHPNVSEASTDPLWGAVTLDQFGSKAIDRVDVAATGPRSPVPPGIRQLPGPGQYYASPALVRLLRTTPADELADRYPGRLVGTIGDDALASPDSLTIIIGRTVADLSHTPGAAEVRSIETDPQGSSPFIHHPGRLQLILAVVAGALLFPVLIFISTATRLAAAQREQRFAAMRLVGATPWQVSVVAAVEALLAAAIGVALGFVVFFGLRPVMARVPFSGQSFFSQDLSLTTTQVLLVVVGVPLAAAAVALHALRRVAISPLGVARRTNATTPSGWRLLPLVSGLLELAYFVAIGRPSTTGKQISAYGAGFLLVMIGLLIAGPWLTMRGARLLARRANRPASLLAGRRLSDNPRGAFRSVSGLIVALFVTTSAWATITTIVSYHDASTGGNAGRRLMAEDFLERPLRALPGHADSRLAAIPGVTGVVVVHTTSAGTAGPEMGPPAGLVSCAQLSRIAALGRCQSGATVATLPWISGGGIGTNDAQLDPKNIRPAAAYSTAQVSAMPVRSIYINTDGSAAAIERVRTALEQLLPRDAGYIGPPSTISEISPDAEQQLTGYQRLAAIAIIASIPIAACSLAVSVAAGLTDRKRPFSLLRLAGTPLGVLRHVVALEAAVPLLAVSALSVGAGLTAADLFLHAQLSESLRPPGVAYFASVATALVISLGIIAATLPLLGRMTGPEVARNE